METGEGVGRCRRRNEVLLADKLMAQVEWKGMCLDVRGMIVARSDGMGPTRESESQTQTDISLAGIGTRAG